MICANVFLINMLAQHLGGFTRGGIPTPPRRRGEYLALFGYSPIPFLL